MTNVPSLQFTPTGLVVPEESAIFAGVTQDMNEALGGGLNPDKRTPQGQIATSQTAIVADKNAQIAKVVNQVNPDTADGFMQDAIARIYFITRSPGAPTNVACQCNGAFGTVIPAGALAQDTSGNRYICTDGGTIPVGGVITLNFANVVIGPIPCPSGTLTTIYKAIPGWDTITNALDGVVGRLVESRAEFEFRRKNSVALNAHGSKEAIYANVFDVPDVLDVFVVENTLKVIVAYGATNYNLEPNSVYVAVVGGVGAAIGQAIYDKKDLGCNMNGNTTLDVPDLSYSPPQPTTAITFNRPGPLPIKFAVQIQESDSNPADIVAQVKAAIIASFNGADGSQRIRIGGVILASKFYNSVNAIGPEVLILSILLGTVTPDQFSVTAGIDQAPTVDAADIDVAIVA